MIAHVHGRSTLRVVTVLAALSWYSLCGLCGLCASCGGAQSRAASDNKTFYENGDLATTGKTSVEQPYPSLDRDAGHGRPSYMGVAIFGGAMRFARPKNWHIRRAGGSVGDRYVEYLSPNAYVCAIYERSESPDSWIELQKRYEEDAKAVGAELDGAPIPVATWNAQGREYVVRRKVKGQKAGYLNFVHEVLLRGPHHVNLLEIAHDGESLGEVRGELLHVMETLQID